VLDDPTHLILHDLPKALFNLVNIYCDKYLPEPPRNMTALAGQNGMALVCQASTSVRLTNIKCDQQQIKESAIDNQVRHAPKTYSRVILNPCTTEVLANFNILMLHQCDTVTWLTHKLQNTDYGD
jgi:hypothetical protein